MISPKVMLGLIVGQRKPLDLVLHLAQSGNKEASFPGYKPMSLGGQGWQIEGGEAQHPVVEFERNANGSAQKIVGWFLTSGRDVVTARPFKSQWTAENAGDAIRVTPRIGVVDLTARSQP